MHATTTRRVGSGLLAFLSSPSATCAERQASRQVRLVFQRRRITSASPRYQQPVAAGAPAAPTPVSSPPSQTDRLRTLETVTDLEPRTLTDQLADPPPFLSEDERQVDWTRSYHGLSSTPFTAEQAAILQQKIEFDDIEIKPDGIIYLPEIKYRRILNRAFGPGGWGLAPRGETIVTGKLVTREYGLVCGGRYVMWSCKLINHGGY